MGRARGDGSKRRRARKDKRPVPKVPQCGSCGEDVCGQGRYCSACGCAITSDVHVEYARYLERIQRMGLVMGATMGSGANTTGTSTANDLSAAGASGADYSQHSGDGGQGQGHAATAPHGYPTDGSALPPQQQQHASNQRLEQYDGAQGVFLATMATSQNSLKQSPAPPRDARNASANSPTRRARIKRAIIVPPRPPPPYKPAAGPQLDSTPLSPTKIVMSEDINRLSAPVRKTHKKFGEIGWHDAYNEREVKMVGKEKFKGIKIVSDNPRATEFVTQLSYFPSSMTIGTENRYYRLPRDDEDVEELVARIYTLCEAYSVQHNIPAPPDIAKKGWLSREPRQVLGKEATEKLVSRLHDESIKTIQRTALELETKYPFKPPKQAPPVPLKDFTSRLYYEPVEKKKDREKKVDDHFAEPLAATATMDPDSVAMSTARLYAEGMDHQRERQKELTERYIPSPARVTRSVEDQKEMTDRLYNNDLEKRQTKLETLRQHYAPIRETRKLTREQQNTAVQRLAALER